MDINYVQRKANEMRQATLDMCVNAGTGHVTSSFSCAEIITTLYHGGLLSHDPKNPDWEGRDRFILSKGQASPILYTVLADRGFFPKEWKDYFGKPEGHFGVHLQCDVPGVEYTMGSLGHGLGIGAGGALAGKMDLRNYHTFVLLGDAECYEGSVWEAAMFAAHHRLNNLTAIVDRNGFGVMDATEDIVRLNPMDDKFRACGWEAVNVNGHSVPELYEVLKGVKSRKSAKPLAVIAETVKGKGIEFMENVARWHAMVPLGEEAIKAKEQLGEYSREVEKWTKQSQ